MFMKRILTCTYAVQGTGLELTAATDHVKTQLDTMHGNEYLLKVASQRSPRSISVESASTNLRS